MCCCDSNVQGADTARTWPPSTKRWLSTSTRKALMCPSQRSTQPRSLNWVCWCFLHWTERVSCRQLLSSCVVRSSDTEYTHTHTQCQQLPSTVWRASPPCCCSRRDPRPARPMLAIVPPRPSFPGLRGFVLLLAPAFLPVLPLRGQPLVLTGMCVRAYHTEQATWKRSHCGHLQ